MVPIPGMFSAIQLGPNAQLASEALAMKPTRGIPATMVHIMDHGYLEAKSGKSEGAYRRDPEAVYFECQRRMGACLIDQFIPENPLTMGAEGFEEDAGRGVTTGTESTILDELVIDSPEAVAEHLERFVLPRLREDVEAARRRAEAAADDRVATLIAGERAVQARFGPDIVKVPYGGGFQRFPYLRYTTYGYANYFTAFVMYPELMERDFALQADLAECENALAARAIVEGHLPAVVRLDHDLADSKGTLVDVRMLDALWFPHFARAIRPHVDAGVRLLWHCDGNLMEMVPRLIEAGVGGFQGFQYEDGMDYERICRMETREGGPLMIWAGVSVTTTLPFGSPAEVRRQLRWLVEQGPPVGLALGASSSVTPGVPWENLDALADGLAHYRMCGRNG